MVGISARGDDELGCGVDGRGSVGVRGRYFPPAAAGLYFGHGGVLVQVGAVRLSQAVEGAQKERDVDDAIVGRKEANVVVGEVFERVLRLDLCLRDW